jgi:Transposase DDE domain
VIDDDYPALLRARRRRERWSEEERRLYRRHRWRSEGYHGEAKTWHGLARAIRRGLSNMKIQAYLTAAAVNLKRLATRLLAFLVLIHRPVALIIVSQAPISHDCPSRPRIPTPRPAMTSPMWTFSTAPPGNAARWR